MKKIRQDMFHHLDRDMKTDIIFKHGNIEESNIRLNVQGLGIVLFSMIVADLKVKLHSIEEHRNLLMHSLIILRLIIRNRNIKDQLRKVWIYSLSLLMVKSHNCNYATMLYNIYMEV